jgi:hypothetical protein
MSKSGKKFLKPTSVLVATLLTSTLQTGAKANPVVSSMVEVAINSASVESTLPPPITLKRSNQEQVAQGHSSHSSHASHASHGSGYW